MFFALRSRLTVALIFLCVISALISAHMLAGRTPRPRGARAVAAPRKGTWGPRCSTRAVRPGVDGAFVATARATSAGERSLQKAESYFACTGTVNCALFLFTPT